MLVSGCGPHYGNVSGKVTYKGKPLAGGTITFFDSANRSVPANINSDGTFTATKVASGQARVTVSAPMNINFAGADGKGKTVSADAKNAPQLPAKYSDPEKSGITYDVTSGDQTKEFALD
jgi:hypothetical protein